MKRLQTVQVVGGLIAIGYFMGILLDAITEGAALKATGALLFIVIGGLLFDRGVNG